MDVITKQTKKQSSSSNSNASDNDTRWKVWPIVRNNYQQFALEADRMGDHNKGILYESKVLSCGFVKKITNAEQLNQEIGVPTIGKTVHLQQQNGNHLIDHLSTCMSEMICIDKNCTKPACDPNDHTEFNELRENCAKLPKQWNVIQLNQVYSGYNGYATSKDLYTSDAPIKIILFRHNLSEDRDNQPISIVLDLKEYGAKSIFKTSYEVHNVLYEGYVSAMKSSGFDAFKKNLTQTQAKLVFDMIAWLGPWLTLFSGKIKGKSGEEFQHNIHREVEQFIGKLIDFTDRQSVILHLMARRLDLLDTDKIKQGAYEIARNCNEYLSIREFLLDLKSKLIFSNEFEYYPCILIVDEIMDPMPWEMIVPLQEFTRVHSIYLLFDLYEKFKHQIDDGYLKLNITNGLALLNPNNDEKLGDMCTRMNKYYDDFLPDWKRLEKIVPSFEQMSNGLDESDLFVYSGHGSTLQLFSSAEFQALKHNCIMMLFGCESISMKPGGTICEAICPSYAYFRTGCPGILGAITIVTDIWIDLITILLLTQWVTPKQMPHPRIDLCRDERSKERVNKILAKSDGRKNSNLLALLCNIRNDTDISICIRSAIVYRGLPPFNISNLTKQM